MAILNYSIGVDIGGTNVAIALVSEDGKVINDKLISTDQSISPETMIDRICTVITKIIEHTYVGLEKVKGIGIGSPGPLDSRNGLITCPPNLTSWKNVPILQIVENSLSMQVILENDANVAALAEKWVGAAQENDNFVYVTISTGIGSGIMMDGKLLRGLKGNAGDIGHTVIDPSFGSCICGQHGCLEAIASGAAIAHKGSAIIGEKISTKDVFLLYKKGHREIVHYIDYVFNILGMASVNIINTFDPEKIVIGGGVSKVGDILFNSIRSYVQQYALNPTGRNTEVVPAKLQQHSGVIGAAALLFNIS